ncbi:MAG: CHAT domain-containing protein [Sphaerospermopsis kisseleviana]
MNEQRLQAYYQLIQQLLSCADGEESAILQANSELLDADFLQLVVGLAGMFSQEGEENTANWLLGLASQLSEYLNIPLEENTPEAETPVSEADRETYLQFLLEVLQATAESEGNPQVVYPLLAANTDKLNLTFANLLQAWATTTIAEAKPETAQFLAAVIVDLGNLIQQFPLGNKANNMEIAITGYEIAFTVFTRQTFPEYWATTQNNLAAAYSDRIRGDKAQNLENAIKAYTAALEVYTRHDFPENNAETLLNLGIAYQDSQKLNLAYDTFTQAIVTVENIRGEIISGEESKRKQAEKWNQLYRRMVEVCLDLGRETEAISYIERSKTRNLVEQILSRDLENIFPSGVVTQLQELESQIATEQNLIQTGKAENYQNLVQTLQELRQQRQQLQDQYLPLGASFNFTSLNNIVDQQTAIIEWYIATNKFFAFVIQPGGKEIKVWQSSVEEFDQLIDWANKYINDYNKNQETWNNQLDDNLQNLAQILHLEEILNLVPSECKKLILIPHRFLHLFPLHALPVKNSYLMDLFPQGVGYVPSLQILQQIQQRQRDNFQSFFAMQTPTEDLYEKDLGAVTAIKKQFANSHVLKKSEAKKSTIIQNPEHLTTAHNLFFFCHGSFDSNSPLDSGLLLADEVLKLADIITHLQLENCRLVTLAACESGMIDGYNISDEYIGLPSGFLLAGSTNVVSSLSTVNSTATALLMIRFYEELKHQNNILLALQTAQIWLRDTTIQDLRTWLTEPKESSLTFAWQSEINKYFDRLEQENGANYQPFKSPVHWSAFCCIGKGV